MHYAPIYKQALLQSQPQCILFNMCSSVLPLLTEVLKAFYTIQGPAYTSKLEYTVCRKNYALCMTRNMGTQLVCYNRQYSDGLWFVFICYYEKAVLVWEALSTATFPMFAPFSNANSKSRNNRTFLNIPMNYIKNNTQNG